MQNLVYQVYHPPMTTVYPEPLGLEHSTNHHDLHYYTYGCPSNPKTSFISLYYQEEKKIIICTLPHKYSAH